MCSGNKLILTSKISVTNFCRFHYFADFDIKIVLLRKEVLYYKEQEKPLASSL